VTPQVVSTTCSFFTNYGLIQGIKKPLLKNPKEASSLKCHRLGEIKCKDYLTNLPEQCIFIFLIDFFYNLSLAVPCPVGY
jgi:hypothetical protein